MSRPSITLWLLSGAVILSLITISPADEPKQQLEKAFIEGRLSLEEFVAKKDSLFRQINESYQSIRPMLEHSCFDCHSRFTEYPWYYRLPVIKGMIDDDVSEAMERLDLSDDFPFAGRGDMSSLLEEMKEEVAEGKMPPSNYRLLHWGTLIEDERRDSLFAWIDATDSTLTHFYE
ncbi:MAG: heme-binding domain-containing protein, partial [Candidatus Zixiibacteriota bacterium]